MAETETVTVADLRVGRPLYDFVTNEALVGARVSPEVFWGGLSDLIHTMGPRNRTLLDVRDDLQRQIDAWHQERAGEPHDPASYRLFLQSCGYLVPEGPPFHIETTLVDPEIALTPGPQLVVPVTNARYALNAANARWGSLYDALYGTDALGEPPPEGPYSEARGARVIAWAREFLDRAVPLETGSHADATRYHVRDGLLVVTLQQGKEVGLAATQTFQGHQGDPESPVRILLRHHGLGIQLRLDRGDRIGASDRAGVADVLLEAAVTAIMDCEDSVATVDASDKTLAYRNWLGLMKGDLVESVTKGDSTIERRLAPNEQFVAPDGSLSSVPGRALMLIRTVGHLMTTPAVLDRDGKEVPEGMLDAMVTVLAATHDLDRRTGALNSFCGSVYLVKPKMHGPDEVAFMCEILDHVERVLELPPNTVKIGIMDEERRTTVNLRECIRAAKARVAFINTGFLDRTGDEIHTSMEAGPMVRKADMKAERWIKAYEDSNVDIGLSCGMKGKAQIGKGMWAAPDLMAAMLEEKVGHPWAGANCAWVPSPTAATLHATHYHQVDVVDRQRELAGTRRHSLDDLLALPLGDPQLWSEDDRQAELDNNAQGILGYAVRWVDQGIGCSKVPDIHNVALMEDRATCRISSQHMANWLRHGVVSRDEIVETMKRMAVIVDAQNATDPNYVAMGPTFDGSAFKAACALVLEGADQPSGYTEPTLHAYRLRVKAGADVDAVGKGARA
ncbi:MAG: malate synthase G [Acidimicrobiales bacterium]